MKNFCVVLLLILVLILISNSFARPQNLSSIQFSAESNVIFFFDRDSGKLYKYNNSGRLIEVYTLKALGKDLELR